VSLNKVSQANVPVATGSEFQFRLTIHVNNLGQARLLQKVLQVWIDGTYTNDNFGIRYLDRPGSYRLFSIISQTHFLQGPRVRLARKNSWSVFGEWLPGGTGHWPVAAGCQPAACLGGKLPPILQTRSQPQ